MCQHWPPKGRLSPTAFGVRAGNHHWGEGRGDGHTLHVAQPPPNTGGAEHQGPTSGVARATSGREVGLAYRLPVSFPLLPE